VATDLDRVRVAHSPLSNSIYLARFGADPQVALDKRDAEAEVVTAVIEWAMHGIRKGAIIEVTTSKGEPYTLTVVPGHKGEPDA